MAWFPERLPTLKEAEETLSEALITEALRRADGNQGVAAALLGISRQALNKRLRRRQQPEHSRHTGRIAGRAPLCGDACRVASRGPWGGDNGGTCPARRTPLLPCLSRLLAVSAFSLSCFVAGVKPAFRVLSLV